MPLTSKQRAELRAEAHHLSPLVHVGHHGANDALLQSLDDVLRTHELVKLAFTKGADEKPKAIIADIAAKVNAEVVQVIGRTATLYRWNPDLKRKKDDPPPWRG
ncbi:MAG: YhbY family RNA-binding protein [Gemmatimonadetes bacterium]|nr:YhbY family RNA-binding protein [Gemmatimonadota bacterium]